MASKNQSRRLVRDRIALDVARFLASGGAVQVIEPGRCGSRGDDNSFLFGFERRADAGGASTIVDTADIAEIGDADAERDDDTIDLVPDLTG